MIPGKPEPAVTSTLGALLTALTFTAAFISVRLHAVVREASKEQRELDRWLLDRDEAKPLRLDPLETHYNTIRNSLKDALGGPAISAVATLMTLGIGLSLTALFHSESTWRDETFWALTLVSVAFFAIAGLTAVDFFYLRRRLARVLENSIVHKILSVEGLMDQAVKAKREYRKAIQSRKEVTQEVREAADNAIEEAGEILEELNKRLGGRLAGHLAGLQAILILAGAFDPVFGDWLPEASDAERLRESLEVATKLASNQGRWWGARARSEEIGGNYEAAAHSYLEARSLLMRSLAERSKHRGDVVDPSFDVALLEGRVCFFPQKPETYRFAFKQMTEGDNGTLADQADVLEDWLKRTLSEDIFPWELSEALTPIREGIHKTILGLCGESDLSWWEARKWIGSYRKIILTSSAHQSNTGKDFLSFLNSLEVEVVQPKEVAWQAKLDETRAQISHLRKRPLT
ncbi:hypothetical protein AB0C13_05135 [Streptomyces sp. NPDC049099]|uniref:hypothetical protein n=1 Tax=Streptomyces sp. NPDC049099 TaxID=3155768 RepID=UPI0034485148